MATTTMYKVSRHLKYIGLDMLNVTWGDGWEARLSTSRQQVLCSIPSSIVSRLPTYKCYHRYDVREHIWRVDSQHAMMINTTDRMMASVYKFWVCKCVGSLWYSSAFLYTRVAKSLYLSRSTITTQVNGLETDSHLHTR